MSDTDNVTEAFFGPKTEEDLLRDKLVGKWKPQAYQPDSMLNISKTDFNHQAFLKAQVEPIRAVANSATQIFTETDEERKLRIKNTPKPETVRRHEDFMCKVCSVVGVPVESVTVGVGVDSSGNRLAAPLAGYRSEHCTPCDEPNTSNLTFWGKFVNWVKNLFKKVWN